jgi:hypothetical protein
MLSKNSEELLGYVNCIFRFFTDLDFKIIRNNVLIVFSIGGAHFGMYIAYFDLNAIMIIDSSSIFRYYLNLTILCVVLIASVRAVFYVIISAASAYSTENEQDPWGSRGQGTATGVWRKYAIIKTKLDKRFGKICTFISNQQGNVILPNFVGSLIVLYFYTGLPTINENNKNLWLPFFMLSYPVLSIFYSKLFLHPKKNKSAKTEGREEERPKVSPLTKQERDTSEAVETNWDNATRFVHLALRTSLGVIAVIVALWLGNARAAFVEETYKFDVTTQNGEEKKYSVFLTSSHGVFVWDSEHRSVSFFAWDSGVGIALSSDSRRSIFGP